MAEENSVIAGAVEGLRMLKDGSISMTVIIEPKDRVAAMALFGSPGQPVALAALKPGYAAKSNAPEGGTYRDLGPLCREAIDLCANPAFKRYIQHALRAVDRPTEGQCKEFICTTCSVGSRKELDTDEGARDLFIAHIRKPFQRWTAEQRA